MLQALGELACIAAPIRPFVLSEAFRLALLILAHVAVAVCEEV